MRSGGEGRPVPGQERANERRRKLGSSLHVESSQNLTKWPPDVQPAQIEAFLQVENVRATSFLFFELELSQSTASVWRLAIHLLHRMPPYTDSPINATAKRCKTTPSTNSSVKSQRPNCRRALEHKFGANKARGCSSHSRHVVFPRRRCKGHPPPETPFSLSTSHNQ